MESKENKINIDVNIYGTRFTLTVPFSGQDAVRAIETEMKLSFMRLREQHSRKSPTECMAMMAYEFAEKYYALCAQLESDASEAEDLLKETSRLCGDQGNEAPETDLEQYGEF